MINEEKVRMMTKIAIYEEGKGKQAFEVGEYYRRDYIGKELIKSLFLGTIAFCLFAALWIGYGFDYLITYFISLDIAHMLLMALIMYGVFMFVYLLITYVISAYRYKKGMKVKKIYEKALKRLESMYE